MRQALTERVRIHKLEDKFGQILVPTEEVVEMRSGQKRKANASFSQDMFWCKWRWTQIHGTLSVKHQKCLALSWN